MDSRHRFEETDGTARAGGRRLAFVLGGGAALGFAHIGVLQVTEELGLKPDLIVGTSMGAIIGAAHAAGRLAETEALACRLGPIDVLGHLTDFAFVRAGWLKGRRVMELLQSHFGDLAIEDLAIPFHAVAADLLTGDERVLSEGPVVAALRASISLPWVFEPVATADALLVDGGMTSPVPMRTARRLGATSLLAVHVAGDHPGRVAAARLELGRASMARGSKIAALAFAVQCDSLVRAERELARPDLFLEPQAGGHEMHAFHRARDLIAIGRAAAEAERHALLALREQRHFEAA